MLPSKELMKELIGFDSLNEYNIEQVLNDSNTMRMCELMCLMKKFIIENGYTYSVGINRSNEFYITLSTIPESEAFGMAMLFTDIADTEFEAVTKACEWILNERI